jgi:predicted nucleic acid-binding protein
VKVVSDTSPIGYLLLIEQVDLLPALYKRIHIPLAVRDELKAAPGFGDWVASSPEWLEVHAAPTVADAGLDHLDPGEREAIALAEEMRADLVLLDEKRARQVARERGLTRTGLLGVLDRAAQAGLVQLEDALERLGRTNFRIEPRLIEALRERHLGGKPGAEKG